MNTFLFLLGILLVVLSTTTFITGLAYAIKFERNINIILYQTELFMGILLIYYYH